MAGKRGTTETLKNPSRQFQLFRAFPGLCFILIGEILMGKFPVADRAFLKVSVCKKCKARNPRYALTCRKCNYKNLRPKRAKRKDVKSGGK